MSRTRWGVLAAVSAVGAAVALTVFAQDEKRTSAPAAVAPDHKALLADFKAAFQKKDAAAIAKLWTPEAEMVTAAGDTFTGRPQIEAAYAALFKAKPNLTAEVESGTFRPLGNTAAILEGVLKLSSAADAEPDVTVFRAVVVKEADGWRFASDNTLPVYGSVDRKTQRAAWSIGEKKEIVFETGVINLTQQETTVLVHFGKDSTQQLALVRLEQPTEGGR